MSLNHLDSNIAVKNVAEVLARQGFLDWLLLVSYEFHFDWHSDQFEKVQQNVITSENFIEPTNYNRYRDSHVFLMTAAMTASPKVMNQVLKGRTVTHIFMDESRYQSFLIR
jgi:hypothetical protein